MATSKKTSTTKQTKKAAPKKELVLVGSSKYRDLQKELTHHNGGFFGNKQANEIYRALSTGNNVFVRANRKETSEFDGSWIDRIEECIPELEEIVKNPRRITQELGNVVPIELAKKTNSESVRHLATHTQNVKEVTDEGDVIPSKILSIENDDFYAIYENRFIATLIRRLMLFVEKRYEFVREHAVLKDIEELKVKSRSVIDGSLVRIETSIKVVKPSDDVGVDEANAYIERILEIRKHLSFCYNSQFMKMMKTEKNVRNPILMTNIIRKNPIYNKCYRLYKYIEGYKGAGVSYAIKDKFYDFDQNYLTEMNNLLMENFLALSPSNPSRFATMKPKICKPKILSSIDDEEFVYGPYLQGPIEFVRVDPAYRQETEAMYEFYREEDVYDKPEDYVPKKERVTSWLKTPDENLISDQRLTNRAIRLMKMAKDALINRKTKAAMAFEKKALEIIEKREQELKIYEEKLRLAEELHNKKLAEEARRKLIQIAKRDAKEMEEDKAPVVTTGFTSPEDLNDKEPSNEEENSIEEIEDKEQ